MEKEYCSNCGKKTFTHLNDFMVEFCSECKSRRYRKPELRAFQCIMCDSFQDESYPGQSVCNSCSGRDEY